MIDILKNGSRENYEKIGEIMEVIYLGDHSIALNRKLILNCKDIPITNAVRHNIDLYFFYFREMKENKYGHLIYSDKIQTTKGRLANFYGRELG